MVQQADAPESTQQHLGSGSTAIHCSMPSVALKDMSDFNCNHHWPPACICHELCSQHGFRCIEHAIVSSHVRLNIHTASPLVAFIALITFIALVSLIPFVALVSLIPIVPAYKAVSELLLSGSLPETEVWRLAHAACVLRCCVIDECQLRAS